MGDGSEILEILIFAAIAGFLVFRLRSVLGRRTGNERRPDPFVAPRPVAPPAAIAPPRAPNAAAPNAGAVSGPGGTIAIKAADPSFSEPEFLRGARGAFEIVVNAFAAGDTAALQPLLSKDVFDRFAEAIRVRQAAQEKLETTLVSMKSAEIAHAAIENDTAFVTVKFVSDQSNVTRAADGTVVDGDHNQLAEHVDFWTFSRSLRSPDPNWTLVATNN